MKWIITKKLDTGQCTFEIDFVLCNNSVITVYCYGQLIKLSICFMCEIGSVVGFTRISGASRVSCESLFRFSHFGGACTHRRSERPCRDKSHTSVECAARRCRYQLTVHTVTQCVNGSFWSTRSLQATYSLWCRFGLSHIPLY